MESDRPSDSVKGSWPSHLIKARPISFAEIEELTNLDASEVAVLVKVRWARDTSDYRGHALAHAKLSLGQRADIRPVLPYRGLHVEKDGNPLGLEIRGVSIVDHFDGTRSGTLYTSVEAESVASEFQEVAAPDQLRSELFVADPDGEEHELAHASGVAAEFRIVATVDDLQPCPNESRTR